MDGPTKITTHGRLQTDDWNLNYLQIENYSMQI